jgi:hypothetical protein
MQEACRKDVERAFGVLQARFAIVARPALTWSLEKLHLVMKTCIILHNMIVEDERNTSVKHMYDGNSSMELTTLIAPVTRRRVDYSTFKDNVQSLKDSTLHYRLRNDLISHLWALKGRERDWGIGGDETE